MKFKFAAVLAILGILFVITISVFILTEDYDLMEFIQDNEWFAYLALLFPIGFLILLGEINIQGDVKLSIVSLLAVIGVTYNFTMTLFGANIGQLILKNPWLGYISLIYPLSLFVFFITLLNSKFQYMAVGIIAAIVGTFWQLVETILILTKDESIIRFFFQEKIGYILATLLMPVLVLIFFIVVLISNHERASA
jgi:hypothetical protein